jgi:predicted DNA-binding WGR domain protein
MNRYPVIDSDMSLDAGTCSGDSLTMSQLFYRLHVQRIDATQNMARFYVLAIEPSLFGNVSVVRKWGRIGTRGQERVHHFENEKQALSLFLDILRKKRRKGYRPFSAGGKQQN